ncbi:hypothetical protein FVE85_0590 [Porphyridium purpureum]|uniref:Small ribosomal subunit protein mS38 n=1 Tax=Porphyridium purpureum TaxID=35688 RepID=A0A5J4YZ08_PORPP|nr:hypothetical protein FVE85_0590 [Porphyridium purpureum]|eukprot:POR8677..scf208_2
MAGPVSARSGIGALRKIGSAWGAQIGVSCHLGVTWEMRLAQGGGSCGWRMMSVLNRAGPGNGHAGHAGGWWAWPPAAERSAREGLPGSRHELGWIVGDETRSLSVSERGQVSTSFQDLPLQMPNVSIQLPCAPESAVDMELVSVKKKRKRKMNHHKHRKRLKRDRIKRRNAQ